MMMLDSVLVTPGCSWPASGAPGPAAAHGIIVSFGPDEPESQADPG